MSHDVQAPFLFQAAYLLQCLSMVDLPESMKTGGFDPRQAQAELEAERNLSRRQQQFPQSPLQMPNVGGNSAPTPAPVNGQPGAGGAQSVAQSGVAGQAQPKPGSYAARRKAALARKEQQKATGQDGKSKDYPNPINLRGFIVFGGIALSQDLTPLVSDILAIGWIVEYIHLPITWIAYWYLIIRRAPRSMKKKFWQRTILVTCIGWIPVVGQFIPEWTATAIGAYLVIARYERTVSYEKAGRASQKNKKKETPAPTPEPAAVA